MNTRYVLAISLLCLALLAYLYPRRQGDSPTDTENTIEIIYMGPGGPIKGAMDDAVKAFEQLSREAHEQDPSKPIYRVISGQNAARNQVADPTRFLVSVAGGVPPDVIYFDRYAVAEWAARGAFMPLDPYIERDIAAGRETPRLEQFYKSCLDEAVYNGQAYAIPNSVDDRALFYNKDLFKRAGLVDENGEAQPPRDWDELKAYAVKLSERDNEGKLKTVGFIPQFGNVFLYIYGWMNGARYLSDDGTQNLINTPEVVEALEYMVSVYDTLGGFEEVNAFQSGFQSNELDPFIQGKVAMEIHGAWRMPILANYGRDLDFGVAPPPLPKKELAKGRVTATMNGGWSYAIPSSSRNKEAAWDFIRFMTSERAFDLWIESEREIAEAQGHLYIPRQLPIIELNEKYYNKYIENNPMMPENFKAGSRILMDLLPDAYYRPVTPVGQVMWNELLSATETALYHSLSPQQALDQSAANVQRELDRFLNPVQGEPITWTWFFIGYGLLLLAFGIGVYLWDTNLNLRERLGRILRRKDSYVVPGSQGGYMRHQWREGWTAASPWLLGFIIFGGGPMLFSIVMSFSRYDVLNPPQFVGFFNYLWMFSQDHLFITALWNTVFMVLAVPLGLVVGLGIALLLNVEIRGVAIWRTCFYLPAIVPMVVVSIVWIWIFNPQGGILTRAIEFFFDESPNWLQDAAWSKPALIIMGLWGAGSGMIIWLAGLKGISKELYEAADLDGCSVWQKFIYVTIPQLTPYIFFNLVMGLIGTFQIFGQAFIMTQGGPADSTLFYVYHLFNHAFRYGNMGYASAMAWVLFVIVLALTIWQLKLSRRWVHYEAE
jgi:ABC-type sugar transport system permease subunit/ABC-type glycerol-3-phosphate transport system substrate-binding protein